jgi:hypothetical protein
MNLHFVHAESVGQASAPGKQMRPMPPFPFDLASHCFSRSARVIPLSSFQAVSPFILPP